MSTMQAWLWSDAGSGLDKNLHIPEKGVAKPSINNDQILIEIASTALNPVDYKIPELGFMGKQMIKTPASPGADFAGRIAAVGSSVKTLKVGDKVFGTLPMNTQHGTLAQYAVGSPEGCVPLPEGVSADDAAAIGIAAITAYQSIKPNTKSGDKIFINGGAGGTGVWGIQIAKALGLHVTVSASSSGFDLVKSLGADEVIDYKSADIAKELKKQGQVYSLVVDNVGTPRNLYKQANGFLKPDGKFVLVGATPGLATMKQVITNSFQPRFLGGGSRKFIFLQANTKVNDQFKELGEWLQQGKVKSVIDSTFEFQDGPKAYTKLKTGRAKGKVVVHVASL